MASTALIIGVTGQDGAYLSKLLLDKGYRVVGAVRDPVTADQRRLADLGLEGAVDLVALDLQALGLVRSVIETIAPDEIYNFAAQSSVGRSFLHPVETSDINAMGVIRLLEALRLSKSSCRFYQASSSEMYGKAAESPQAEQTSFHPRSPYGVSKLFGHAMTVNYREAYGLFACSGILFNHESPLRAREFVTRKITLGFAQIASGVLDCLELGNVAVARDWGFAGDYVRGMWQMLQQNEPDDYVLATGTAHSLREFVRVSAQAVDIDLQWEGEGVDIIARDSMSGQVRVRVNPDFYRPTDIEGLEGDASKARRVLGWEPTMQFEELVHLMVAADVKRVDSGQIQY